MVKMKKETIIWSAIIFIVTSVLVCIVVPFSRNAFLHKKQDELAEYLGLDVDTYNRAGFPDNYFYRQLSEGMTRDEVHAIVKGYEAVYLCYEWAELYYFFDLDDDRATRFMIMYDNEDEDEYVKFISEDKNSRVFGSGKACEEGNWDN